MYENLLANVPTDLWIGGKWRKASDGGRFDVIDPATERTIASVASGGYLGRHGASNGRADRGDGAAEFAELENGGQRIAGSSSGRSGSVR